MSGDAFPIGLSFAVAGLAVAIAAPLGIAIAWIQARVRHPFRRAVDVMVLVPMVLPPTVVGFLLVLLLGRNGVLGPLLQELGVRIIFTPQAAVIASAIAALPVMVKAAQPAFESVPRELEDVGRSLGLGPLALFLRVTIPSAWRGLLAGLVLSFARAVGEFGATLMFAGNSPGRTNTMPLEIFAAYQAGDDLRALLYVLVLFAFAIAVAFTAARLTPREAS